MSPDKAIVFLGFDPAQKSPEELKEYIREDIGEDDEFKGINTINKNINGKQWTAKVMEVKRRNGITPNNEWHVYIVKPQQ